MIQLDTNGYRRLYSEVLVIAMRITHTKNSAQQPTQADRAREATQRAFERLLRMRPDDLDTVEKVRRYLVWSVRSELSNAHEQEEVRQRHEYAAAVEQATVGGAAGASAEVVHIEFAAAKRRRERAARALQQLRAHLAEDSIALGTIDCLEKGKSLPAEQARMLGCSVPEIHAARKRRIRALEKILAAIDGGDDKEKV